MFVHNSWMLQDAAAELKIELQSSELRKELRVTDLVFTQVLGIVGLGWIGTAGKLGSHQLMFWLAAIFLFQSVRAAETAAPLTLWYQQPAEK